MSIKVIVKYTRYNYIMEYTEKKWDMKILSKWKKPVTKDYILYDSIYMKCPEYLYCSGC